MITLEFTKKKETWFAILPHGKDIPVRLGMPNRHSWGSDNEGTTINIEGDYYKLQDTQTCEKLKNNQNFIICFDDNALHLLNDAPEHYITRSLLNRRRLPPDVVGTRCRLCLSALEQEKDGHTCFHCNAVFKQSAVCKGCLAMGFQKKHTESTGKRIMKIYRQKSHAYAHFPQCMTKSLYRCHDCKRWIDNAKRKTALAWFEGFTSCDNMVRVGLCKSCEDKKKGHTIFCGICKQTRTDHMEKTKGGYVCQSCLKAISKEYKTTDISFDPIRKSPDDRTFGIELEINNVAYSKQLAEEVGKLNIDGVKFAVKEDGSVYYGMEIVSNPASKEFLFPAIKALCKVVRQYEHTYSRSGLHVHVGDNKNDDNKISYALLWVAMEYNILSLMKQERRSNEFCQPICQCIEAPARSNTVEHYLKNVEVNFRSHRSYRYRALNFCALEQHGTVEARCMDANTDHNRIRTFIEILDHIWSYCNARTIEELELRVIDIARMSFSEQLDEIGIHPMTIKYLRRMQESLAVREGEDDMVSLPPERTKYSFKSMEKDDTICPNYRGEIFYGALSSIDREQQINISPTNDEYANAFANYGVPEIEEIIRSNPRIIRTANVFNVEYQLVRPDFPASSYTDADGNVRP